MNPTLTLQEASSYLKRLVECGCPIRLSKNYGIPTVEPLEVKGLTYVKPKNEVKPQKWVNLSNGIRVLLNDCITHLVIIKNNNEYPVFTRTKEGYLSNLTSYQFTGSEGETKFESFLDIEDWKCVIYLWIHNIEHLHIGDLYIKKDTIIGMLIDVNYFPDSKSYQLYIFGFIDTKVHTITLDYSEGPIFINNFVQLFYL